MDTRKNPAQAAGNTDPAHRATLEDIERFGSLMAQAPFSIQVFSPDGQTLRVNRAFEKLWGVRFEQMQAYNILEDPQMEAAGIRSDILRAFAGESVRLPAIRYDPNDTVPGISPDADSVRWLSAVMYPLKDASGLVREVVIIHEDTTAQVRAEEEQRRSERTMRSVLESVSDGFFALDHDWRFTYVNPQAEILVGRTPGELIGRVFWDEFPGTVGSEFEVTYRRVVRERTKASVTAFYADHDRWYEVHVYPATDGGISVYFHDVSERVRSEAEIARLRIESEQQRRVYETALSNSADFHFILDPEGRLLYANQPLLALWGKACQEDVVGKTPAELDYPAESADRIDRQVRAVIASGQPVRDDMAFTSAGIERHYEYILSPVIGRHGEVEAVTGSSRDITDRKLAEEALRESERELRETDRRKDEFLATLAHELRNPLAPIRNSLEILKMPRIDPAVARQTREMMERQVHHLVRLVDDLLDVSRVMRGKIDLRTERVELATVIARAIEIAQPLIDASSHRLELEVSPDPLPVEGDPVRLAQVIGNLLTNAARYTDTNGTIRLSAVRESGEAVLRVRDNGIGIAPGMLRSVFDLFVQVDHGSSRSMSGLGVGLTLVSRLVELHGGSVVARSEGLDKGSEFAVRLPLAGTTQTDSSGIDRASGAAESASGLRLLVVDDNADAAESLAMLLRMKGHDVRIANDGRSALELASADVPDVVFLDIGMPGMDGCEVARLMRAQPKLGSVVLAALTGWGQVEDRRRTAEAGFDHHLVKPIEPDLLERLLEDATRVCRR